MLPLGPMSRSLVFQQYLLGLHACPSIFNSRIPRAARFKTVIDSFKSLVFYFLYPTLIQGKINLGGCRPSVGMLKPPRYLKTLVAGVLLNYFRSVFFKWGNRGQERLEDLR